METDSTIALFADDSYLYRRILSKEDSKQLQTLSDQLWSKCASWQQIPKSKK